MRSQRRSIARIHNQAAQAAIQQIKKKKYSDAWKDYTGEVVLVGINYDKDKKDAGHSCRIEHIKCSGSNDVL